MSHKQARLITAVRDAMENKGIRIADLARACGCTSSLISTAMSGKGQMREERWRMCCEYLGLDYEEIVADLPQKNETEGDAAVNHEVEKNEIDCTQGLRETIVKMQLELEAMGRANMVLAAYAAKHLREDIKQGMDIGLKDLRILLDAVGVYIDEIAK